MSPSSCGNTHQSLMFNSISILHGYEHYTHQSLSTSDLSQGYISPSTTSSINTVKWTVTLLLNWIIIVTHYCLNPTLQSPSHCHCHQVTCIPCNTIFERKITTQLQLGELLIIMWSRHMASWLYKMAKIKCLAWYVFPNTRINKCMVNDLSYE